MDSERDKGIDIFGSAYPSAMRFGTITRVLLLGGGATCIAFARIAHDRGFDVRVATSERHAAEDYEGDTFACKIREIGIEPFIAKTLKDPAVHSLITDQTLGISFGAAWIFTSDLIKLFNGRLVNVHAAQLPRDRGAGGFSWRILRGDRSGSLCLHLVETGIDTGPILKKENFEYPITCRTPGDFSRYTLQRNLPFLDDFLGHVFAEAEFPLAIQDESASTYYPRLNTENNGWIDWSWDVSQIERFICAFDEPYSGASTLFREQPIRLRGCAESRDREDFHPFMSGLVYRKERKALYVAAKGGGLIVSIVEDLCGRDLVSNIPIGTRFHTPRPTLDSALTFHAVYTPNRIKG
jgi:methionyl-tRNA formyltransferase